MSERQSGVVSRANSVFSSSVAMASPQQICKMFLDHYYNCSNTKNWSALGNLYVRCSFSLTKIASRRSPSHLSSRQTTPCFLSRVRRSRVPKVFWRSYRYELEYTVWMYLKQSSWFASSRVFLLALMLHPPLIANLAPVAVWLCSSAVIYRYVFAATSIKSGHPLIPSSRWTDKKTKSSLPKCSLCSLCKVTRTTWWWSTTSSASTTDKCEVSYFPNYNTYVLIGSRYITLSSYIRFYYYSFTKHGNEEEPAQLITKTTENLVKDIGHTFGEGLSGIHLYNIWKIRNHSVISSTTIKRFFCLRFSLLSGLQSTLGGSDIAQQSFHINTFQFAQETCQLGFVFKATIHKEKIIMAHSAHHIEESTNRRTHSPATVN